MIILDLETTGLDPNTCDILEVGALRVDDELNVIDSFGQVVKPEGSSPFAFEFSNPTVFKMHDENGLWADALGRGLPLAWVEYELMKWVMSDGSEPGKVYMAGDSIHFDRSFIKRHMPVVDRCFHHRMVDTSSFMVAFESWGLTAAPKPEKAAHRALADCWVSLNKLRFYRDACKK